MRDICPICEKITDLEVVKTAEIISIRGEDITVPVKLFKCAECGGAFEDPASEGGPVELAYTEFRKRKGLIQPDEIRDFRVRFGLTQTELGKILGFGGATISRYENGALQDDAHDKSLRLAMNPYNLERLIQKSPTALHESKRKDLLEQLAKEKDSFDLQLLIEKLGMYEADELSGFKTFDYTKFLHVVLFFCKDSVFTTCLNKLLFYADFLHFKTSAVSLTGLRYAHMTYGPAPHMYHSFLTHLLERGMLESEEFGNGERYSSLEEPDIGTFNESELRCLLHVKAKLGTKKATELSDYSHEEAAYKETRNGDLISYTHAESLSLILE